MTTTIYPSKTNAYRRHVYRRRAYGKWKPLVDAGPAREYVLELKSSGLGLSRIAVLAGVGDGTVRHLIYGEPAKGLPPTKRMRPQNVAALLAVRPSLEDYAPGAKIAATGTRRRLQALCAIGWPASTLSDQMGRHWRTASRIRVACLVEAGTAVAVRDLYDRLWDQAPPSSTADERRQASRARSEAVARGWAPPLAWDDESIDDPAAEPVGAGYEPPKQGKLPDPEEIAHLVMGGDSIEVIADRYGVTAAGVQQKLTRAGESTCSRI